VEQKTIPIDGELVSVNPEEIKSLLGVPEKTEDPHTLDLIATYISDCKRIMAPRGGTVSFKAIPSISKEEIAIVNAQFRVGKIIKNMLRGAEEYHFFIATAGPGPEELSGSLIHDGHYLDGYVVDLIGSAITESVAQLVHERIREEAGVTGKKVTNRYSPGYCGWEVDEQQKLFDLFPGAFCGITLSDSSLMSPIKSISGLIGTGASVSYREYTCEICSMKECIFRRTHPSTS